MNKNITVTAGQLSSTPPHCSLARICEFPLADSPQVLFDHVYLETLVKTVERNMKQTKSKFYS